MRKTLKKKLNSNKLFDNLNYLRKHININIIHYAIITVLLSTILHMKSLIQCDRICYITKTVEYVYGVVQIGFLVILLLDKFCKD